MRNLAEGYIKRGLTPGRCIVLAADHGPGYHAIRRDSGSDAS